MDQHDEIVDAVADTLRADAGIAALTGGRVYRDGEAPAEPTMPYVLVRKGRAHGIQKSTAPVLAQRDVRVESVAENRSVMGLLLTAVQGALNGKTGGAVFDRAVLTHTGDVDDASGFRRQDVFGVFVKLRPTPVATLAAQASQPSPAEIENAKLREELAKLKAERAPAIQSAE